MLPLILWFLRHFGLKTGTDFTYFAGLNSSMVFEEMKERICRFNSKLMNKKERVIWEAEVDFKKSFCWRSNVSNDIIISAYARSENGYGFYEDRSGNGCEKKTTFWSGNRGRIWRTGWHTPTTNSEEYPPPVKFTSVTSSVVLSFSCLLILLFLSREHRVLSLFLSRLPSLKRANIEFSTERSKHKYFCKLQRS